MLCDFDLYKGLKYCKAGYNQHKTTQNKALVSRIKWTKKARLLQWPNFTPEMTSSPLRAGTN